MFCSQMLLTIDRPRLEFRTRFNNRPHEFHNQFALLTVVKCTNSITCYSSLGFFWDGPLTYSLHAINVQSLWRRELIFGWRWRSFRGKFQLVGLDCVCEVGTVGKISDYQPEGSGFKSPAWSRVKLWETFFRHTVRGQGR